VLLGIAVLEADVLPLHIAQVTQALLEGWKTVRVLLLGAWVQHADQGDFPLWLCRCDDRGDEDAKGERDNEYQRFHWITSSAKTRSVGGNVIPSA
jgi:hypothetical protein